MNLSYIGGLSSRLDKIKDVAIPSGLGLIYVSDSDDKVEQVVHPLYTIFPYFLEDIKNEISVLQNQKKTERSFSSFGRTHILNYFSPIYLFNDKQEKTKSQLSEGLQSNQWIINSYREFINGAQTIGLLEISDNGLRLSKLGIFCLDFFKSIHLDTLSNLQIAVKNSSKPKSLFSEYPRLAKFLQLLYFQNPDFKRFISILISFERNELTFKEIMEKLIVEYPNLFLNFFVKSRDREKVINVLLTGNKDSLLELGNNSCLNYGYYNFFFAFKRHLVHLGILSPESKVFFGRKEDFKIIEDLWILGDNILL